MAFQKKRWDKEAQENGKWMDYDGGEFLIANIPNVAFTKGYVELGEKYKDQENSPEFKEDLNKLLATTVLKDWKGVVDDDDKEVPYTVDEGVELLSGDEPFGTWLFAESRKLENFKREVVAKRTKK